MPAMLPPRDRHQLRRFYYQAWAKARARRPLEPLERVIAGVIERHPEYHGFLETGDEESLDKDYLPELGEANPFLHLSLHVALDEQLEAGRPPGLVDIYRTLLATSKDGHAVEHRMMECLAEALWQAQRSGTAPSEAAYLACLRILVERPRNG